MLYTPSSVYHAVFERLAVDDQCRAAGQSTSLLLIVAGRTTHSGDEFAHGLKVAPVQHEVIDLLGTDGAGVAGILRLHGDGIRFHGDRLRAEAYGEDEIRFARLAGVDKYMLQRSLLKASHVRLNGIRTRCERLDRVEAVSLCH